MQGTARLLHGAEEPHSYKVVILSSRKNYAFALFPQFDIDRRITIFKFKLLANYEGNCEHHD